MRCVAFRENCSYFLCHLGLEAAPDLSFLERLIIFYSAEKILFQVTDFFQPSNLRYIKKELD